MSALLADIGGTHARIALYENGVIGAVQKHNVADFKDAAALFDLYKGQSDTLMIAAAGRMRDDGIWRVTNHNSWEISPAALENSGFQTIRIVNDFVGLARGVIALEKDQLHVIRKGVQVDKNFIVAGAGTGLGLATVLNRADLNYPVLASHGGHNLAVTHTQEQKMVVNIVRRLQNLGDAVCYEDMVSGRGLPFLYQAVSIVHGLEAELPENMDLKVLSQTHIGEQTLRLFHEFFGYFLQAVVIQVRGSGGIYLDGGVTQKLHEYDLLDRDTLFKAMEISNVPTIMDMLRHIPVYLVNAENTALLGLSKMVESNHE